MRKITLTFVSLLAFCYAQAQQPHRELGYDPGSNILTTVAYGYGNSVDRIIFTGQDQTSIKVNNYGFPTEIVNSVATVDFQYSGASSVTITQTMNGETKKTKLPLNSEEVLSQRNEYRSFSESHSVVGKIDEFLSNGGAQIIGTSIDLVTRDTKNSVSMCFEEALKAAKKAENPIIPVTTLQQLRDLTNIPSLGDLITDGYNELTESVADFFYKREMEKYNAQKEANRKKNEERLEQGKQLLEGNSSEDVPPTLNDEPGQEDNAGNSNDSGQSSQSGTSGQNDAPGQDGNSGNSNQDSGQGGGSSTPRPKASLETAYFYFDNPDGTIEAFPEYCYPDLRGRMMSISSSKYATPTDNTQLTGTLKQYENILNLYFGRQTRTTVFVFDGQESAQAAMMTSMIYSSSILGMWAALEEGMREKFSKELTKANIPHTTTATWKNALKQGKPEELMFNGHEGGRIVNKIDLSNSWLSLMAGANIEITLDNYFYYDEQYDKIVGVVFYYSDISDPKGKYDAAAYSAIKAISGFMGYTDPTTGNTTLASMFEHRDMIDFFKEHFHLKKPSDTEISPATKCVATFVGTPQNPAIELCGKKKCISIECLINQEIETRIREPQPPTYPPAKKNHGQGGPEQEDSIKFAPMPEDGIVKEPEQEQITEEKDDGLSTAPRSKNKFAVIGQLNHASVEKPFAENDKYIYFMQDTYQDNAVLAIDKTTGELSEAVPGKRKGNRPGIISIGAHGNDLYLDVEGQGLVRYNGKNIESSEKISDIDRGFMDDFKKIVISPNGRYLAYAGQNCAGYVIDLKAGNKIVKNFHDGFVDFLVTDDGDFFGVNNFRALVYRNNGSTVSEPASTVNMSELLNDNPVAINQIGDNIYIAGGKKVMKTEAKSFVWKETASLAGNDLKLYYGALAADGAGFAYMSDRELNRFAVFAVDNDRPTLLKKLATGINVGRSQPLTVETARNIHIDSNGNIWMAESSGAGFIVVYNPKGIAHLKSLAGKFINQK